MKKKLLNKTTIATAAFVALSAIAATLLTPRISGWMEDQAFLWWQPQPEPESLDAPSAIGPLAEQSAAQRRQALEIIANQNRPSLDRSRARYLLASDLIERFQGGPALKWLEGLETDHPTLAPYILLKRGRAYQLTNETQQAAATWQQVVEAYPNSPYAAEALYWLGQASQEPDAWNQVLANYPAHPRSLEIARQRLAEDPDQPDLLRLLARHDPTAWETRAIRDRLSDAYGSQLTPEDWQAIADGYWESWQYNKAAQTYPKAPRNPQNLYRAARSAHIEEQADTARQRYQQLIQEFPTAPDTGLGLRRLASLSRGQEAIAYLDRAAQFPEEAPQALLDKARLLAAAGNAQAAAQTRQQLLDQYGSSEAAAEYRWNQALVNAAQGNLTQAWDWARGLAANNPDSPLAPKAIFWVGKWAQQLNRSQDAVTAFERVLSRYPESYYAWRSAVLLGWDVGDFGTVRQLQPSVTKPQGRSLPPAGSEVFQELYRLGQTQDAWPLFAAEIADKPELTVAEQFTDGLQLLDKGRYLQGINRIWSLRERQDPQDRQQWQQLRETPDYWYALFPFPYEDTILKWSGERQLNPLLVTSLIRQESRFERAIQSPAGATGLMQVLPSTAEWIAEQIGLDTFALDQVEDNVKLGSWYFDFTHREYGNNSLLAVASYNAGPGNVSRWIRESSLSDPDVFVENIPFRETKGYVESVFGNYWNYLRIYNPQISQKLAQFSQPAPSQASN